MVNGVGWHPEEGVPEFEYAHYLVEGAPPSAPEYSGRHHAPGLRPRRSQLALKLDWFDAYAYATWRNCRLPTEAQWEKAAQGTGSALFPWGDTLPDRAAWGADPNKLHARMMSEPAFASPWGCLHMGLGVWEWCGEWFVWDAYDKLTDANPDANHLFIEQLRERWGRCAPEDRWCLLPRRALRGGGDRYGTIYPAADRWHHSLFWYHHDFGVRCVLPLNRSSARELASGV